MEDKQETVDLQKALVAHAQRQTKALENINVVMMFLLVVTLIAAGALVISGLSA